MFTFNIIKAAKTKPRTLSQMSQVETNRNCQVQHMVPRQSSLYRVPYLGSAGQSLFQKPGGEGVETCWRQKFCEQNTENSGYKQNQTEFPGVIAPCNDLRSS